MIKDNEYFSIFFIFSGVIHILLLTINFAFDDNNEHTKFLELNIKLGVDKIAIAKQDDSSTPVASIPKMVVPVVKKKDTVKESKSNRDDVDISALKLSEDDADSEPINLNKQEELEKKKVEVKEDAEMVSTEPKIIKKVVEVAAEGIIIPKASAQDNYVKNSFSKKQESGTVGSKVGNVIDSESQDLVTYEQMLPLWLKKFKIYPEQAVLLRLSGKGVIKVTIKRNGKVLKAEIEESTGHPILDSALLSMVERADPVIPVPPDHLPEMGVLTYKMAFGFYPDTNN